MKMHRSFKNCIQPNKESKEREKALQQKITELTSHIQRLERCMALLRTENEDIRKKQFEHRTLEEKIRSLKKRNSDLSSNGRRLEEKIKQLTQEISETKYRDSRSGVDHGRSMSARQRAKEFSTHSRSAQAKDREIEHLRRKCNELSDQLSRENRRASRNSAGFEGKEEYVNIIKMAAKERLQLEHQIACINKNKQTLNSVTSLGNKTKQQQIEAHDRQSKRENSMEFPEDQVVKYEQIDILERQLKEKSSECTLLSKELCDIRQLKNQLEHRLSASVVENHQLMSQIRTLQGQVQGLDKITEEFNTLKLSLEAAEKEKEEAEDEVQFLNRRVHSLENVVRDLQESAEHVDKLEKERKIALQKLQQKQARLEELQQINSTIERKHTQTVSSLNKMVVELKDKMKVEEEKRNELAKEIQRLQKEAAEREKVVAEQLNRKELAVRHQQTAPLPASKVSSANLTAFPNDMKFRGEEGNKERTEEINKKRMQRKSWNQNEPSKDNSLLFAWAHKGPIQVYVAKYNYDPFQLSPNENPEAELQLRAGDYVLVVGEMDEDGFFDGELIDGSQGLVPSNFIEKVEADEDLLQFHTALMQAGHREYSNIIRNSSNLIMPASTTRSAPDILSSITNIKNSRNKDIYSDGEGYPNMNALSNADARSLQDIRGYTEGTNGHSGDHFSNRIHLNGEIANSLAPCPRNLSLDRLLPDSVQFSWKGPDPTPGLKIQSYHVLVDGQIKALVRNNERTKAVLEGINDNTTHRICVRCLSNRGESIDAQCTMLIGKDAYPVPSKLNISHISPTSAFLTWLPGNSNYQHVIIVNGEEMDLVKPSVFYHLFSRLTPATLYTVTLTAKSVSGVLSQENSLKWVENVSASIEFSTLDSDQVQRRKEDIRFHLSNQKDSSSGVESLDSEVDQLSKSFIKEMEEEQASITPGPTIYEPVDSRDGEDEKYIETDEETEEIFQEAEYSNEDADAVIETYSASSCTELSDIPEVEEDLIGSQDSCLNEVGTNQKVSRSPMQMSRSVPNGVGDDGLTEFPSHKLVQHGQNHLFRSFSTADIQRSGSRERVVDVGTRSSQNTPVNISRELPTRDVETPSAFKKVEHTQHKTSVDVLKVTDKQSDLSNSKSAYEHKITDPAASNFTFQFSKSKDDPVGQNLINKMAQMPGSHSVRNRQHIKHLPKQSSSTHAADDISDFDSITGEINPAVKANSVRLFIALFDYDPVTMSPNVNTIDEELPFKEGQVLKVFGQKDADGFYKGGCNGRMGYIPCNMVCEIQIDDPDLLEQLLQEIERNPEQSPNEIVSRTISAQVIPNDVASVHKENTGIRKMVALYDYDPQTLSPNIDAELELSFKSGDIVTIHGDMDEDGFYTGEINNKRGLVPSNFLQPFHLNGNRMDNKSQTATRHKT